MGETNRRSKGRKPTCFPREKHVGEKQIVLKGEGCSRTASLLQRDILTSILNATLLPDVV